MNQYVCISSSDATDIMGYLTGTGSQRCYTPPAAEPLSVHRPLFTSHHKQSITCMPRPRIHYLFVESIICYLVRAMNMPRLLAPSVLNT